MSACVWICMSGDGTFPTHKHTSISLHFNTCTLYSCQLLKTTMHWRNRNRSRDIDVTRYLLFSIFAQIKSWFVVLLSKLVSVDHPGSNVRNVLPLIETLITVNSFNNIKGKDRWGQGHYQRVSIRAEGQTAIKGKGHWGQRSLRAKVTN